MAATSPLGSVVHVLATIGSIFALLRAALFIHELAHLKPNSLPGFETHPLVRILQHLCEHGAWLSS